MEGENIVFLHIPRTAGKTFKKLSMIGFKKFKFSKYIHFPRDYTEFDINTTKIFTLIRNPKDRYLSEFTTYFQMFNKNYLPLKYIEKYQNENIIDFQSFIKSKYTHNTQTKMLLGHFLYQKEEVTIDDADKVLKRIESDEIIPLKFEDFLEIIDELKQLNPKISDSFFKSNEIKSQFHINSDEYPEENNCNQIDEYLYNTIVNNLEEKTQNAKDFIKSIILRKLY